MKKDEFDWTIMKWSVINVLVCLLVSSSLAVGSYYFREKMEAINLQKKRSFQSISQRYLAIDEEEKLIRQYFPEFVGFDSAGIIGREHRLNWIEILRQISEEIQLPALSYEISSREEFTPEYPVSLGVFRLFSSSMRLDLGLLHEGDLLQLLKGLDERAEGTYTVSECEISRKGKEITRGKGDTNINAKCLLNWFTIELANGQKLEFS